jgi:SAM-dependent methyltransferase
MRLYSNLANWWPALSPPAHYVDEAADLLPAFRAAARGELETMLELGCGGGSLAYQLKAHLKLTLTDVSPQMLAVSRAVNPECEHRIGDMRTLDLEREFDVVMVHDAIMYATSEADLRATLATAARHCRAGGCVALLPDYVRETFEPGIDSGGEDLPDGRGLRYLEWTWDPDPADTAYEVAYAFLLREPHEDVRVEMDRHTEGLFARAEWLSWIAAAGFEPHVRRDPWGRDVFTGSRIG